MPPEAAFLFAAGLGTRMAPLTDSRPKPLVEVAGRPLLDHALDLVRAAGVAKVAANSHFLAPMLSAQLARRGVIESHEPTLLDTGGGLKAALPLLDGPAVFTLNTDAVWTGPDPVEPLRAAWAPDRMGALLALIPTERATGHRGQGDFDLLPDGRLIPGRGHVYTGLQIIATAPLSAETETIFSLRRVWQAMLHQGRLFGHVHRGGWCDVGRPDCLPLAEAMLAESHV